MDRTRRHRSFHRRIATAAAATAAAVVTSTFSHSPSAASSAWTVSAFSPSSLSTATISVTSPATTATAAVTTNRKRLHARSTRLCMKPLPHPDEPTPSRRGKDLSATTFSTSAIGTADFSYFEDTTNDIPGLPSILDRRYLPSDQSSSTVVPQKSSIMPFVESFLVPVLSASLMITGNTVGAGMLVLPELSSGPGMALSTTVLIVAWFMNLTSGLTIAQVAIQEHESSGTEVPSSFKEFAEATLPDAAGVVSGISVFINTLILAFDVFKAGQYGDSLLTSTGLFHMDPSSFSIVWVTILGSIVATQRLETLSVVASVLVMGLFTTFAGLLLPGLAHVSDPMAVFTASPTLQSGHDIMDGVLRIIPVAVTTLVFQNIVPTVTRLLDYDRTKITTAIITGTIIPLMMYLAWCTTVLSGGFINDETASIGTLLFSVFSLITVGGSSLGSVVSLSEELSIILQLEKGETFSIPSVFIPIAGAMLIGHVFAEDITSLLGIAGSYGSPLLYGAIPVAMAWSQMQGRGKSSAECDNDSASDTESLHVVPSKSFSIFPTESSSVIPGGVFGLALLGLGSISLVGTEFAESLGQLQ